MANKQDMKALRAKAEAAGWTVSEGRGSNHMHWKSPVCGHKVFSSKTPSDARGFRNHLKYLRDHGWESGTCAQA